MVFEDLLTELNSSEFPTLRSMQHSVLEQYEQLLDADDNVRESDIAVEMPAGTGKTLVALLISEFYRQREKRIAILAGTKQLANQIAEIASDLGIPICVFEGPGANWNRRELRKYQRRESIAIMNYWAYFNLSPTPVPAEILIMDDAHLAENAISDLFSIHIEIRSATELYTSIVNTVNSLQPGRHTLLQDILLNVPANRALLVPFTDYLEVRDELVQLLDEAVRNRLNEVRYLWPRLRSKTDALALFITPHEVQFRPFIYPTQDLGHFNDPLQRIYLSATLGDPSDLQRRLGCKPVHLISPSNPQPGERGRRMIVLMPQSSDNDDVTGTAFEGLRMLWPVARKRLWMCSSWPEAEAWEELVPPLKNGSRDHIKELRGGDDTPLEEFRQARIGHLFTAGRYDGIDLPGDQCRLAIIPSPPVVSGPQEEFFSEHLRDATFLKSRFSQRVAQALGRCNRDAADFAVYVFLDPRFERRFGGNDPEFMAYLPPDIQPEMEAALENCENDFLDSCEKARQFLTGSFSEWDSQVDGLRPTLPPSASNMSATSPVGDDVSGWLAMWRGDPTRACIRFRSSVSLPQEATSCSASP